MLMMLTFAYFLQLCYICVTFHYGNSILFSLYFFHFHFFFLLYKFFSILFYSLFYVCILPLPAARNETTTTLLAAATSRLSAKNRNVSQKPKFSRSKFTLVHLSAVVFASIIILISAMLGKYRKKTTNECGRREAMGMAMSVCAQYKASQNVEYLYLLKKWANLALKGLRVTAK